MRKLILCIILTFIFVSLSLVVCLAAYNDPSPPSGYWNFTANRTYTVNGNMDVYYYFSC